MMKSITLKKTILKTCVAIVLITMAIVIEKCSDEKTFAIRRAFYKDVVRGRVVEKHELYKDHSSNYLRLNNNQKISLQGYQSTRLWSNTSIGDSLFKDSNSFVIFKIQNNEVTDSFISTRLRKLALEVKDKE